MKKKNNPLAVLIIVVILSAIGIYGVISATRAFNGSFSSDEMLSVPLIKTNLTSSSDGTSHYIETKMSLTLDESANKKIKESELYSKINEIVTGLDYDKLSGYDGISYMKGEIAARLSDYIGGEDMISIYVTDLADGFSLPQETTRPWPFN